MVNTEALAKQDKEGVTRTVEALMRSKMRRLGEDVEVLVRMTGQTGGKMVVLQPQTRRFLVSRWTRIPTGFRTRNVIVGVSILADDLPADNKQKSTPQLEHASVHINDFSATIQQSIHIHIHSTLTSFPAS